MEDRIIQIRKDVLKSIDEARDIKDIEAIRIKYLGRNGIILEVLRALGSISPERRPVIGRLANSVKQEVSNRIQIREKALSQEKEKSIEEIDITMPGLPCKLGHIHPITNTMEEISDIFIGMGFRVVEGPEIETEYYNFEALNIPKDHPSRESFHTFYVNAGNSPRYCRDAQRKMQDVGRSFLLRSQTSTVQIRIMEKEKHPLRIVAPGRVFRPDATDASHLFMFHQIEGLMVDSRVSFSDLKGMISIFICRFFGEKTKMRFRPHFFPFTEPSVEVDIACLICNGRGCGVCSSKGWLEILGAGMVDPAVFEAVGYSSEDVTGFAFGMGIERIAMLKYNINDIRLFYENDIRFLEQF